QNIRNPIACRIRQRKDYACARVVDQGINPAPVIDRNGDRALGIFGGGNIRDQAGDVLVFADSLLDRTGTATGDEHFVALPGETQRRRASDAGGAAGHDNNLFTVHFDFLSWMLCFDRYCAVQTPWTEIAVRVIWSAAAEHRKATVSPSCAGEAKSSDGCFSAKRSLVAPSE